MLVGASKKLVLLGKISRFVSAYPCMGLYRYIVVIVVVISIISKLGRW
jgi:hypothetical protein